MMVLLLYMMFLLKMGNTNARTGKSVSPMGKVRITPKRLTGSSF
jgi:hypothetical protein